MPRFGSVWLEAVCLVPNETSVSIVDWMRLGSICPIRARRSGSKFPVLSAELGVTVAALADPARMTMGAVIAVAAEADRNARRLGRPFEPETSLFSMPQNQGRIWPEVKPLRLFALNINPGCVGYAPELANCPLGPRPVSRERAPALIRNR